MENGKYPAAMMVKELISDTLAGHKWVYQDSPVMAISEEAAYSKKLVGMKEKGRT